MRSRRCIGAPATLALKNVGSCCAPSSIRTNRRRRGERGSPMRPSIVRLAVLILACALVTPASAQLIANKDLSLAMALTIATTAAETCKAQGHRVSVAVVGRNGELLVHLRGDG